MVAPTGIGAVISAEDARQLRSATAAETITRTLRFGGSGDRTLDVRLINGSIRVTGTSEPTVRLEVRRSTRAESDADARAAEADVLLDVLDDAPTVSVIARERGSVVCGERNDGRWSGGRPRYRVSFDVTVAVPAGTRLRLCNINGGDIHVERTTGDFEITHVNGPVAMAEAGGSGRIETVNGAVTVSFAQAPREASTFKTINGDVAVTFPRGLSADLRMKTFNGDLLTDFDVQALPGPVPQPVERRGGTRVYRSNDFTRVRVARGGPELTLESFNGDVRVVRAAR